MTSFGQLVDQALTQLQQAADTTPRQLTDTNLLGTLEDARALARTLSRYLDYVPLNLTEAGSPWAVARLGMAKDLEQAQHLLRADPLAPPAPEAAEPTPPLRRAADLLGTALDLLDTHHDHDHDQLGFIPRTPHAEVVDHPGSRHLLISVVGLALEEAVTPLRRTGIELHRRTLLPAHRADAAITAVELLAHVRSHLAHLDGEDDDGEDLLTLPVAPMLVRRPDHPRTPAEQLDAVEQGLERLRLVAFRAAYEEPLPLHTGCALATAASSLAVTHHLLAHALAAGADLAARDDIAALASQCGSASLAWRDIRHGWLDVVTVPDSPRRNPVLADAVEVATNLGRALSGRLEWTTAHTAPDRATMRATVDALGRARVLTLTQHVATAACALAGLHRTIAAREHRHGRVLVPTRSIPEGADVPRRYSPMPATRAETLVAAYTAAQDSDRILARQATALVDDVSAGPGRHRNLEHLRRRPVTRIPTRSGDGPDLGPTPA
ncbi:MAG: hypothetical protein ACTHOD_20640 [Motilibacteraceae bacterium]